MNRGKQPEYRPSNKQSIFAEQIRRKNRQKIWHSIRENAQQSLHVRDLIANIPESLHNLYSLCKQSKSWEFRVAQEMAVFLESNPGSVDFFNLKVSVYWGMMISLVFQYEPKRIQPIIDKIGWKLFESCKQRNNYQIIYIIMAAGLQSAQNIDSTSLSQTLATYITKVCINFNENLTNNPNIIKHQNLSYDILFFFKLVLHRFPDKIQPLVSKPLFLYYICSQIDNNLNRIEIIEEIVKILVLATYHDTTLYSNITEYLLSATIIIEFGDSVEHLVCDILGKIKFLLDFINIKRSYSLPKNLTALLGNLIENQPEIMLDLINNGTHQLLYQFAFDTTPYEQQQEKQQNKRQSEPIKKVFLWKQRVQFAKGYMIVCEKIVNAKQILDRVRDNNIVEKVLHIIDCFGEQDLQILEISEKAIQRILQVGDQIMEADDSKLNPYALKLYHLQSSRVLGKFTEVFGHLLDKYSI